MGAPYMGEAMEGPLATPREKPSRSILDGVLKTLFPAGAYEGIIPEESLADERRMALRRAGLSLLAGAGPRAGGQPPHNFLGDVAGALDPGAWDQRLQQVAQTTQQLRTQQQKMEQEQQIDAIMATHPARPGETPEQQDARLLSLANAFTQAGLMEYAKEAADLRVSLRAPALGEKDGILYDSRTGVVVGSLPTAMRTVEGSQLYAQALQRLQPWDRIRASVALYNQKRAEPLTGANTAALISAAQDILNTHSQLAQSDSDMNALKGLPIAGQLFKVLQALGGSQQLTEAQRQELLKAVDPVINRLGQEHQRVLSDVQRIFRTKWKTGTEADEMLQLLPLSPSFRATGVVTSPDVRAIDEALLGRSPR